MMFSSKWIFTAVPFFPAFKTMRQPSLPRRQSARLLSVSLLLATSLPHYAQTPTVPAPAPVATMPTKIPTLAANGGDPQPGTRLADHLGDSAPVKLMGVENQLQIPFSVPQLSTPLAAHLHVAGQASLDLNEHAWLVASVNDRAFAQRSLQDGGEFAFDLNVPPALIVPGFNRLRLEVIQHYTDTCEYPMAPQLWTQIDTTASSLSLELLPRAWTPTLDGLDKLFDKATVAQHAEITLIHAGSGPSELPALSLAAQGVALRHDYVPTSFRTLRLAPENLSFAALAEALPPDASVQVTIGTRKQLAGLLPKNMPAKGPVLAVRKWPQPEPLQAPLPPPKYLVLISGDTDGEVLTAAQAFSHPTLPWPPVSASRIPSLAVAPKTLQPPPLRALQRQAYSLWEAGFTSRTLRGIQPGAASIRIWNGGWQRKAQIRVHAEYAAGLSPMSALNVSANGIVQGSLPLDRADGGRYDDYAVTLDPTTLHPGWNTIELEPVLIPQSNGGDCKPFFPGNLAVTLFDDSTFEWVGGIDSTAQDLALLAAGGTPYLEHINGSDLVVGLAATDADTLSAALTLIGKLAQRADGPLTALNLTAADAKSRQVDIWVGTLSALPAAVLSSSGLSDGMLSVSVADGLTRGSRFLDQNGEKQLKTQVRTAWGAAELESPLTGLGLAANGEWQGHPVTTFTAQDAPTLRRALTTVVGYGTWDQLRGHLAWWRIDTGALTATGWDEQPFHYFGLRGGLAMWVSRHPWWSLLILLSMVALFVIGGRILLRRKQSTVPLDEGA